MAIVPMQGMHSMWNDHYKGSVYPLLLDAPPVSRHRKARVLSLLDICCSYIVKDSNLTKAAIEGVPNTLYVNLMEAALLGNHDRSIHFLMSKWIFNSLVLSKLVPSVFSSVLPLYEPVYQSDMVRQGLRYTTSLAHTFLECIRQNAHTKIRYLDLSGFPTAEVILYYLTSHCMLVHNESRRDNMVTLYNQAVHIAEEFSGEIQGNHNTMDIDMQNCIPNNITIIIKLDAFVTSESCHSELCKALTVSSFPSARFQICIEKLSVTCLGGDRVNLLLRQVNSQELKGLQLKYNSIRNTDLIRMSPVLQSFTNLTALDLSCNHVTLTNNEPMLAILIQALGPLRKLERLDLSNFRLKGKMGGLLRCLTSSLKQLRFTACGLGPSDFSAMAGACACRDLEELDLSENNVSSSEQAVVRVLSHSSHSLRILELEDCCIEDEALPVFETCFENGFNDLLYLNVAENSWASASVNRFISKVCRLRNLKALRLSYSRDCYPSELLADVVDVNESKELFKACIADNLRANSRWEQRTECVQVKYVDLEKI